MLKLKISLMDSIHEISRIILIKNDLKLNKLHQIIQKIFGFEDINYHFFYDLNKNICYTDDDSYFGKVYESNDNLIKEALDKKDIYEVINAAKERYKNKSYLDESLFNASILCDEVEYIYDELSMWKFKIDVLEENAFNLDNELISFEGPNLIEEGMGAKTFNTYLSILEDPNQALSDEMIDYISEFGLELTYPIVDLINKEIK